MQQLNPGPLKPGKNREAFLEKQPTYWLKRSYQALRRSVDAALRDYGITLSQRDVLLTLYEEGPLDQRTLTDRLGLEQSSVSRLVEGLVRRDLVHLQNDSNDRRVRIALVTPKGKDILVHTPGSSQLGGERMLKGLSEIERRELVRLLSICHDNLLNQDQHGGKGFRQKGDGNGR